VPDAPTPGPVAPPGSPVGWRPLVEADAPAWSATVIAAAEADGLEQRYTPEDLLDELRSPGVDPALDSMAAFLPDGRIAAAGMVTARSPGPQMRRYDLEGTVHPEHRRSGLGRGLLAWQEARARAIHARDATVVPGRIGVGAEERQDDVVGLATRAGFAPARYYTMLRRPIGATLPDVPPPPDGVRIEPFDHRYDEAVRAAHNDAWTDHWGYSPRTAEGWRAWVSGHRNFRADWSRLALTGQGDIAGYVINFGFDQDWPAQGFTEGYTMLVGVRRPWRGRGVAANLLADSMSAFRDAGLEYAGLDVDSDNPTGALQLYLRLGYVSRRRTVLLDKEIPPAGGGRR
jgi:ribosomal protein S18 acetylase RimI-like enzyme